MSLVRIRTLNITPFPCDSLILADIHSAHGKDDLRARRRIQTFKTQPCADPARVGCHVRATVFAASDA